MTYETPQAEGHSESKLQLLDSPSKAQTPFLLLKRLPKLDGSS